MKVSPVAIKLSLPGLTNVKKEKVLGITLFAGVLFCHSLNFDRYRANHSRYSKYPDTPLVFHPVFFTGIPGNNE
jgi:hypothetical protein